MKERRKEKRMKTDNEIAVTIVDDRKTPDPDQEKSFNNHSKDVSMSGAKIKYNILLPVDTLILIKMKLKNLGKRITIIGKVKWNKGSSKDTSYEAGVEFVDTPEKSFLELEEFISRVWMFVRTNHNGALC